eukprot:08013.XXX_356928_357372_1 [CDS] Oithona nana genome sequencing.
MWSKVVLLLVLIGAVFPMAIDEFGLSAFKCEDCNLCDTLDSNNYGSDCETNCGFCPLCYIFNIDANAVEGCKWCKRGTDDKYGQNTCLKLCLKGEENCSATGPCQTQCGF